MKKIFQQIFFCLIMIGLFFVGGVSARAATMVASQIGYYTTTNNAISFSRSLSPMSTTSGSSTVAQIANPDGSVTLNINNSPGYSDAGFYLNVGTLADLKGVEAVGPTSSSFGINIWFDKDNNNEHFVWNNNVLTGLGSDSYILGPTSQSGLLSVSTSSPFTSLNPGGGNYTLAQLQNGVVPGISSSTKISIWIGINISNGSSQATINSLNVLHNTPLTATLHVIKVVVNGSGGTAIPSNFNVHIKDSSGAEVSGSPTAGVAAPGTSYSLSPGTYTISEDANTSYTQSFPVGDCDSNGAIVLSAGDDKICTIINTNIPPPVPLVSTSASGGGGGGGGRIVPVIALLMSPSVSTTTSGATVYNYLVWNAGGMQALTNVSVTDDKCPPGALLSGDTNSNNKLDPGENWKYSCTTTLSKTTTNTAVATGYSDDGYNQAAIATVIATVPMSNIPIPDLPNAGLLSPLITMVKVPVRLTPFPFGGGNVVYAYAVTNPGTVPVHDVVVSDDKCGPISKLLLGDTNHDNLLDPGETWTYICQATILVSTRSVGMAEGKANGLVALSHSLATVLVANAPPGFPETGPISSSTFAQRVRTIAVNLGMGNSGDNVAILQQFLISQNKGLAAQTLANNGATAYFGKLTRAALIEFQISVGISPALGNFGAMTRAYISAHY